MPRRRRLLCTDCKHVWRIPISFYEEEDHCIHGCTKPYHAKFAGWTTQLNCDCKDYENGNKVDMMVQGIPIGIPIATIQKCNDWLYSNDEKPTEAEFITVIVDLLEAWKERREEGDHDEATRLLSHAILVLSALRNVNESE